MPSTTASWARPVKCWEEIPPVFRVFVPQLELLPYIIYSPADNWGIKQTNAKLTCIYQEKIIVLEVIENEVNARCYWFKDINYIEQGKMLLYSWIGINGLIDGKLSVSIVEYNSVVVDLFHSVVKAIRKSSSILDTIDDNRDLSKLDFLNKLNYKFFNYSHDSILSGERIIHTVYQPDIYEKFLIVFKKTVTLAHVTILTDKELIIIKDEELVTVKKKYDFKNGGVWAFIPLCKIIDITIDVNEKNEILTFVISVEQNKIYLTFSSERRQDLEALITGFNNIKKLED